MMSQIRRYFLSGLVVFLPLVLTIYLFVWVLTFLDNLFGKFIAPYFLSEFGFYFSGLSIVFGVLLILTIGFLATNYFGHKLHQAFEAVLLRLPFFKQVYPAFKEIALFLFSRDKLAFQQVVIIQYPRHGLYTFGFLTNQTSQKISQLAGRELCNVFVPSSPGPVTGYVVMVPKDEIIFTELSVEDTLRVIVSGGVVNPYHS